LNYWNGNFNQAIEVPSRTFLRGLLRKFHGSVSFSSRSAIVLMTWVNCHASRGLIQSTGDALNAGFRRDSLLFPSNFFSLSLLNAVERAVKKCESLIGGIGSFTRLLAIRWSPQFRSSIRPWDVNRRNWRQPSLSAIMGFPAPGLYGKELWTTWYDWSIASSSLKRLSHRVSTSSNVTNDA